VAFADRVLISKIDIAESAALEDLAARMRGLNPAAPIDHWQRGDSPVRFFSSPDAATTRAANGSAASWLRGPLRPQYAASGDADGTDAMHGEAFQKIGTQVLALPDPIDWATYAAWTQALSARFGQRLLRCKGLLALGDDGAPWVVQGVQGYFAPPERLAAWPASVPHGFLVCIGESITRAELDAIVVPTPSLH